MWSSGDFTISMVSIEYLIKIADSYITCKISVRTRKDLSSLYQSSRRTDVPPVYLFMITLVPESSNQETNKTSKDFEDYWFLKVKIEWC